MATEPNRIWHEPEVIIYSNLITPGTRCSAEAYDLANRRWYQLNVEAEVWEEDWLSRIITDQITEYYHAHATLPPFNVIHTTREGIPTTFDFQPDDTVARPVKEHLYYNLGTTHPLPTTSFDQLVDKVYLGRAVDRCIWRGKDCVFKRIEFDCDVKAIDQEIKVREALIASMRLNIEDSWDALEQNFRVVPILAVVFKQSSDNEVMGILMPFGGASLESILASESSRPTDAFTNITGRQLGDLAHGVRELARAGVQHGDINGRNTLLQPYQNTHRLVMVDLGDVAPDYKSDAYALGDLFLWCRERSSWDMAQQRQVEVAAQILQESGDFDKALDVLDNGLLDGLAANVEKSTM